MSKEHRSGEDRRAQPFDVVQKPAHYNKHPSGVEAIELCEVLSFNVGNAFKYIYRRDDKANPIQDLNKAMWYLRREIQRLSKYSWLPSIFASMFKVNPEFSSAHDDLASAVIRCEPDHSETRLIYGSILWCGSASTYVQRLEAATFQLEYLIKSYQQ